MENRNLIFNETNLSNELKRALDENGYVEATPIQTQTLPYMLDGKDIIGQSQTGTGKTAAYGLPIIDSIDVEIDKVQALILCPTRELALQVVNEMRKFAKYKSDVKCLAVYGGENIERQIQSLKRGVKIVVGTPGRIIDHMRRRTLKFGNVKTVVLDEADEMLNMGFEEDMETILNAVPEQRQTVLYSATMNDRILGIAKKYLKDPVTVKIKSKELTVDKIKQIAIEVKQPMKEQVLTRIIDINNPEKTVVFCNTKKKVDDLIESLKQKGYKAESLHGDIKQIQRERIMKRFKAGEFPILVATDVVARGIDVDGLELVVNYDVPQEDEYYVHRIGRTGRNGADGKAYTFVVGREKKKLFEIEKYAKTKINFESIPTDEEIREVKNEQLIKKVQDVIDKEDYMDNSIIMEMYQKLSKENDNEKLIKALIKMAVGKQTVIDKLPKQSKMPTDTSNVKLFLSLGKKDNIKVKDIVGSIASNVAISGSEIGKINILDKFSFVEVPARYAEELVEGMYGKKIKGKDVVIEFANK